MKLSRAWLLTQKEWKESFNSPMPYLVLVLFFLVVGWFFTGSLFLNGQANLDGLFGSLPLLLSIFLPALTMRLFAEEFKTGTMETLSTLPLEDAEIVLGKYGAVLSLWLVMVGLSLFDLFLLVVLGPPDLGQMASGFVGTLLLGMFFGACGLFASALTRSQVVAFLLGFLLCFFFFIVGKTAFYVPGGTGQLMSFLGVDQHFENFLKGVIDSRDVLYFLSGTLLALAGTQAHLHRKRHS